MLRYHLLPTHAHIALHGENAFFGVANTGSYECVFSTPNASPSAMLAVKTTLENLRLRPFLAYRLLELA
jgi:hypothetical protein